MKRIATCFLALAVACVFSCPAFGNVGEALAERGAAASVRASSDDVPASGAREYQTNATGAARAKGRTAETVKALTDAAVSTTNGYTFGDLVGAVSVPDTVHVAQFGAHGDGVHDDRDALQAAFNSGAKTILFEKDANYKVNSSLALKHGDVTLLGNSATIVTDAAYNDSNERLLSVTGKLPEASMRDAVADDWKNQSEYFIQNVGIYQLNFLARAYAPADAVAEKQAYSKQLMVQLASNVDIFGCTLVTEKPQEGQTVDGYTALDAYTGWHDLTVENCAVRDFCDKEAGGGMWVRDHFNMGAANAIIKGNDFQKICHDEILAVFNTNVNDNPQARPVSDVLIAENKFTMDEDVASSSVMAFTVKCARDVLIENNDMNVKTTGGLVWSDHSSGVVVRDNDIAQTRSHVSGTTNFLMFRGTIDLVENNRMTLAALDAGEAKNDVYVFAIDGASRGNTVTSDMALSYVADGGSVIEGNDLRLNAPVHVVFNGCSNVQSNKIELNAHANQYFQYFKTVFAQDVALSKNVFENKVESDAHSVLVLNNATMGGHVVRLVGNELKNAGLGQGARLLFLQLLDEDAQESCVVFAGNEIADLEAYGVYCPDARHTYVFTEPEPDPEPEPVPGPAPDPDPDQKPDSTDTPSSAASESGAVKPSATSVAPAAPKIAPKGTSLSRLVGVKRGFRAKWKRQKSQITGYELQYSLKKNFRRAKTLRIGKPKTTSKKVGKLKPKKRYYVRVRTFKKVGGTIYRSAWSKTKSVRTRS